MPSFIVHSIVGCELQKKLNLDKKEKELFFIANLLPDVNQIEVDKEWTDEELRKHIQKEKRTTHFRTYTDGVLESPDLDYFLSKYDSVVKSNIVALGYFFHLYTDYYYFSKFLPSVVTFLDENDNEVTTKELNKYIRINKTNKKLPKQVFWSKKDSEGIYQEYSRLNKYLVKEYNFKFDYKRLKEIIKNKELNLPIKEINSDNIDSLIDELNGFYLESLDNEDVEFKIFSSERIDYFINTVVDNFIKEYDKYLKSISNR